MNDKVIEIAICRNGGTKVVEYKGIRYYIDHRIGSPETHGWIFDAYPSSGGERVSPELEKEIHALIAPQQPQAHETELSEYKKQLKTRLTVAQNRLIDLLPTGQCDTMDFIRTINKWNREFNELIDSL